MHILTFIYRLAVAFWVGGIAIFSFVLTPIIFRSYNRDMAGEIVGRLFPAYFRWGLACGVVSLIALVAARGRQSLIPAVLLVLMLCVTSFQTFYVEPKAAELKREIPSFETTPKDHPLRREFSRLHGVSAICNIGVFAGGVVLVALL